MKLKLYHGSANIIEKPEFGLGNAKNDYGLGFIVPNILNWPRNGPALKIGTGLPMSMNWKWTD